MVSIFKNIGWCFLSVLCAFWFRKRQLAFRKIFILKSKKSIGQEISEVLRGRIEENRKKLKVILQRVLFCGRQKIPLRGHQDDGKYLSVAGNNPGNFKKLFTLD